MDTSAYKFGSPDTRTVIQSLLYDTLSTSRWPAFSAQSTLVLLVLPHHHYHIDHTLLVHLHQVPAQQLPVGPAAPAGSNSSKP